MAKLLVNFYVPCGEKTCDMCDQCQKGSGVCLLFPDGKRRRKLRWSKSQRWLRCSACLEAERAAKESKPKE
jgi:hypothetical protein